MEELLARCSPRDFRADDVSGTSHAIRLPTPEKRRGLQHRGGGPFTHPCVRAPAPPNARDAREDSQEGGPSSSGLAACTRVRPCGASRGIESRCSASSRSWRSGSAVAPRRRPRTQARSCGRRRSNGSALPRARRRGRFDADATPPAIFTSALRRAAASSGQRTPRTLPRRRSSCPKTLPDRASGARSRSGSSATTSSGRRAREAGRGPRRTRSCRRIVISSRATAGTAATPTGTASTWRPPPFGERARRSDPAGVSCLSAGAGSSPSPPSRGEGVDPCASRRRSPPSLRRP